MKRSTTARGYGTKHQQVRKQVAKIVNAGRANCWRCNEPILLIRTATGIEPEPWDLGHDDYDRTKYRGPEHAHRCNRAAGARKGNAIRRARAARRRGQAVTRIQW